MKVYVCYELNNHELAIENGSMQELTVFVSPEKAREWFLKRIEQGKKDGFLLDREDEMIAEDQTIDEEKIIENIGEGYAELTMFAGYQENWNESYAICVFEKEVE